MKPHPDCPLCEPFTLTKESSLEQLLEWSVSVLRLTDPIACGQHCMKMTELQKQLINFEWSLDDILRLQGSSLLRFLQTKKTSGNTPTKGTLPLRGTY